MSDQEKPTSTPARAMVVVAHPDDAEFGVAGTVAKWTAAGSEVIFVLGTSGDKGSDDPEMTSEKLVETREREQRAAAAVLGVKTVEFLRFRDAELMPDLNLRLAITRMIRTYKPDAVICQDPTFRWGGQEYINHPDHSAMGEATLAAIFPSARDRLTFPQLLAEGLEPHKVTEVFVGMSKEADFWVDITESFPIKLAALKEHFSQLGDWDFEPMMRRWSQDSAAEARAKRFPGANNMELAESYKYFKLD
ncbi:MAG TPA: PIG-L deacetylase family protein [Nitrolancea sp.]|nr:PIG-L deacetylase family protein [Nitrolancea sp.]